MKSVHILGLRAKLQSAEGTPATCTATDAVLLAENPTLQIGYAHDGGRASKSNATMGNEKRVAPSGRTGETTLKIEPRGLGAAYGASALPNFHAIARLMGLDAAITTTGGAEKVVYTRSPGPAGFAVGTLDLYSRGQLYGLTEVYGSWTLGANGPEVPMLEVAIKGLLPSITDVSIPTMTYGASKDIAPPKAINMAITVNAVVLPKPRSWSIKGERAINPRLDLNGAGHGGFAPSQNTPTLELTYEQAAFATLNPYALWDAATEFAWSFALPGVQYNKHAFAGPAAQITNVSDETDDPAALVKVSMQLNPSAYGLNDEFAWTFD